MKHKILPGRIGTEYEYVTKVDAPITAPIEGIISVQYINKTLGYTNTIYGVYSACFAWDVLNTQDAEPLMAALTPQLKRLGLEHVETYTRGGWTRQIWRHANPFFDTDAVVAVETALQKVMRLNRWDVWELKTGVEK